MRVSDEVELVSALKNQIDLDKNIENVKIDLALTTDFNLKDLFRIFDTKDLLNINIYQFDSGCRLFGFVPTNTELNLVFNRFDIN